MSILRFVLLSLIVSIFGYDLAGAIPSNTNLDNLYFNSRWHDQQAYVDLAVNNSNQDKQAPMPPTSNKNTKKDPSKEALRRRKLLKSEPPRTQKAWLYSAIVPGLGQAYNRKYWKLGLFYGGFALTIGLSIFHHQEYRQSKRELLELKEKEQTNPYTNLSNYIEGQKRERNMYLFIASLWYIVNVFDAYVDGTLKTFDVSDNLEVIIEPTAVPTAYLKPDLRVGVSLHFKP
jgi:hypothetical protein